MDVSLTVCEPTNNSFKVAIIPYTKENTNFADIEIDSIVNIEFDILGKYIARLNTFTNNRKQSGLSKLQTTYIYVKRVCPTAYPFYIKAPYNIKIS